MIDLDELQSVRDRERQTDKLQQLRESFYADAGEFIQELRDQRERAAERADDPFDAPEVNRLSDEIDTAEQTVEAIYEKRVGKIVKAASFAAADLPAGSDGMTREEQQLFETLVGNIKENRQHVLDVLAGEGPGGAGDSGDPSPADPPPQEPEAGSDSSVSAADVMGQQGSETRAAEDASGAEGADESRPAGDTGSDPAPDGDLTRGRTDGSGAAEGRPEAADGGMARETVRITADVGAIFGVDEREYDLAEDDVVQLPAENAGPLVDSDAAERLD